jgi:HrpA-like RNA helicase
VREKNTKSIAAREAERMKAAFPIYLEKDTIVRRLKNERLLVVIAATGAGKTTQIPQYCAEAFPGKLVACTQPRAIAMFFECIYV